MTEYYPDAKIWFKDGWYPETRVKIHDSGWVELPDYNRLCPPQSVQKIEYQYTDTDEQT